MMPPRPRARLRALIAAAVIGAGALSGCQQPAAGEDDGRFTLFMSPEDEKRVGREQHQKVIEEFGGVYDDPEVARYVDGLGQLLASTSERPGVGYTFTVLDSPIVNAFALPGGYVYVTRGLMALADNEAELAGVVAHEIGHVAARHGAERYSRSVVAGLGLTLLGVLTDSQIASQVAGLTAELVLKSYSREQEMEADTLGIRYLARAGFDPDAMTSFLQKLQAHDRLQGQILGRPDSGEGFSFFSTHPRTADRVAEAMRLAAVRPVPEPIVARELYLEKIDGMLYGDNPDQGFIRGRAFAHPKLRFRFEVPAGFRLLNSENQVVALGPEGAKILFTAGRRQAGLPMTRYLAAWAEGVRLRDLEPLDVNGMAAATGWAPVDTAGGPMILRLVAIAYDSTTVYRFIFLVPPQLREALSEGLRRTTYSFRRLSAEEAAGLNPLRLRIVRAAPGETAESLAARQPFESFSVERFRVLNGLAAGQQPAAGELVKIVSE